MSRKYLLVSLRSWKSKNGFDNKLHITVMKEMQAQETMQPATIINANLYNVTLKHGRGEKKLK